MKTERMEARLLVALRTLTFNLNKRRSDMSEDHCV